MPSPRSRLFTPLRRPRPWLSTRTNGLPPDAKTCSVRNSNIIHCPIGKVSFGPEKLTENYNTLMGAIVKAKPAAAKGQYIRSCVAAATMGPGVRMNTAKLI